MTKKTIRKNDPFLNREKKKYQRPVPSREYLLDLISTSSQPLKLSYFVNYFKLDEEEQEGVRRRLIAMVRDGQICRTRKGFTRLQALNHAEGRLVIDREGSGKLWTESGPILIPLKETADLFDGDEVRVAVTGYDHFGKMTGEVVELIKAIEPQIIGKLIQLQDGWIVRPLDKRFRRDISIASVPENPSLIDQIVLVTLLRQKIDRKAGYYPGQIIEFLGEPNQPGIEIEIAKRKFNLPTEFPEAVKLASQALPKQISPSSIKKRIDLRHLNFVTIDGADAKDFDDAVYCTPRKPQGWRLYVAIADVSHYVKPRSELDKEALARATSMYFPGHVIPMLPEALSNELCSLKPHVDRLALVCELCIKPDGSVTRSKFYEGVIQSQARLTYQQVADFLDNKRPHPLLTHVTEDIYNLNRVYLSFLKQRKKRGAIDFDTNETQLLFNSEGKIKEIVPVVRNTAHRIIEECMLAANVAAAKYLTKANHPTLYRIHEPPPHDKLTALKEFLSELGLSLGRHAEPEAKDYQRVLNSIKSRDDAGVIQTVMLRSLSQARYSQENNGHFGLAYEAYLHFTSPIRRYPDLMVHRAIKKVIADKRLSQLKKLPELGDHCSNQERLADEATRDAILSLKCEYLSKKVGETFYGVISTVVPFGLFVALTENQIEGLIHVTSLGHDYYIYDAKKHRMVGERSGVTFKLGDKVKVRLARVGLDDQKIDFELIGSPAHASKKKKRDASRKGERASHTKKTKKRKSSWQKKKSL